MNTHSKAEINSTASNDEIARGAEAYMSPTDSLNYMQKEKGLGKSENSIQQASSQSWDKLPFQSAQQSNEQGELRRLVGWIILLAYKIARNRARILAIAYRFHTFGPIGRKSVKEPFRCKFRPNFRQIIDRKIFAPPKKKEGIQPDETRAVPIANSSLSSSSKGEILKGL